MSREMQCAHMHTGHCGKCARLFKTTFYVSKQSKISSRERHWWNRELKARQAAWKARVERDPIVSPF